jgi:CRP-like cAMP-binding protein
MDVQQWQSGFISHLSERLRAKLLGLGERFSFHAGDVIFHEGDRSAYLYVVKHGTVELGKAVGDRTAQPFATVGPGDIFSWSALVKTRVETATARALDEVEVIGVRGATVDDLCWQDTDSGLELYRSVLEVVSARLKAMAAAASEVASAARAARAAPSRGRMAGAAR